MLTLIYPILVAACIQAGGAWCWLLLPFNILLVPAVDHSLRWLAPGWRPSGELLHALFAPGWFAIYAAAQAAVMMFAFLRLPEFWGQPVAFFGLASAIGIMTGTGGITASHELMHRRTMWAQALGQFLLGCASYMHFAAVHLRGHHRHVGTVRDPGTARLGESFPAYLGRVMVTGVRWAWSLEATRLHRKKQSAWSTHNRFLRAGAFQLMVLLLILVAFGPNGLILFMLQSFIAVHLLEAVNYVQHYGLARASSRGGLVERVDGRHAWDSDYRLSELLVFNLPRHADHHIDASKTCAQLIVRPESPKLPLSFFLMVFLALIPPLWRALMDGRAVAWQEHGMASTPRRPRLGHSHGALR